MNTAIKLRRLYTPWRAFIRNLCPNILISLNPIAIDKTLDKTLYTEPIAQHTKLHNGLRIVTKTRHTTPYACIGLYIDAGSRYENKGENGIIHFYEHLVFNRTKKRDIHNLKKAMSLIGANFGCFTTREMVCYYVQCLKEHVPEAVDLISDCVLNNALCDVEILKQKEIVYYEMLSHDEDSNVMLYDYLHRSAFQGTPLAQSVIGPSTNLCNFSNCTIECYLKKVFEPSRIVLAAVGGVNHNDIITLADTHLSHLKCNHLAEDTLYRYTGSDVRYRDDSMPVANVIIAVEGPSLCHKDNVAMEIARCAMGGWDRSQVFGDLLPVEIARAASKKPLCDAYKAFNINYKDTGLWGVQFISDVTSLDCMSILIQQEWMYLCTCITESEVDRAKRFLKTKLLSKNQSSTLACHDAGRWTLYNGKVPSLAEKIKSIDSIHFTDIRKVCTRYLYDRCPTVAAIGRTEGLMEYQRIRSGMFWLRC